MTEPVFLGLDEIIEIHHDQIKRYGGRPGILDVGILKSTVAMPSSTFDGKYLHTSIYEIAAAYLFYIVRDHPFVDGNKRVGAVASIIFLMLNGVDFQADEDDLEETVLGTAEGKIDKAAIARFFEKNSQIAK